MRYTRSNFKKWLQKMPPDSRPFSEELCPIAKYCNLDWSFQGAWLDAALAVAIDIETSDKEGIPDYDYGKLTPRKILSIIKRLEK